MPKVIEIQDIEQSDWESLVKSSSVSSWFQTREAYGFYSGLSFLETFAFGVEEQGLLKALVVGYVQKDGGKMMRYISRRAIINGGPLLSDDIGNEALGLLLKTLKYRLKRKAIYIETRNFNDYSRWRKAFVDCGFEYEPHYDIWVDTSTAEHVEENLGKSRRRDIRVSLREGASVVTQPTIEQVRDYYKILRGLYQNKVKTPLFPLAFFERLYRLPSAVFLLVQYDGQIVGGTVCVGLQDKALYELYACGKDGACKGIFPSELATYAGLQYAVSQGLPCFDMMGAGRPDDGGYGVREFKLKFGGKLHEFGRYEHVCNRLLYGIGQIGVKIMKSL